MSKNPCHKNNIVALKRIEGQIRGIQKMIEDERPGPDVIVQIHAAIHALHRVRDKIFATHVEHCVDDIFTKKTKSKIPEKIDEIMRVMKIVRKFGSD